VAEPSATATKPSTEAPESSAIGDLPEVNKSKVSVGPMDETVPGEKRDLDSTLSSTPTAAEDTEQPTSVPSNERDTKKQKKDDLATESNGTASTSITDSGEKKASRPKKEKIKDAVSKIIPDGIGRRTRSQTKGT
jgi:hypothetical protein